MGQGPALIKRCVAYRRRYRRVRPAANGRVNAVRNAWRRMGLAVLLTRRRSSTVEFPRAQASPQQSRTWLLMFAIIGPITLLSAVSAGFAGAIQKGGEAEFPRRPCGRGQGGVTRDLKDDARSVRRPRPVERGVGRRSSSRVTKLHCPCGGCQSSTLLPSGSMTHPNFPYSESSVFSSTLQPSSRSALRSAARSSTR